MIMRRREDKFSMDRVKDRVDAIFNEQKEEYERSMYDISLTEERVKKIIDHHLERNEEQIVALAKKRQYNWPEPIWISNQHSTCNSMSGLYHKLQGYRGLRLSMDHRIGKDTCELYMSWKDKYDVQQPSREYDII